jgi:hypothetical protein
MQDPHTGTCVGLRLERLHTCLPGEAEHASLLLAEDAGSATHSSAAAKGSVQKQFAVEGLALYWQPGNLPAEGQGSVGEQVASPSSPQQHRQQNLPEQQQPQGDTQQQPQQGQGQQLQFYLLQPTNLVLHTSLQLTHPADAMRVHTAVVVHQLPLCLSARQAADALALADRLAWCAARNKYAALCPTGWRTSGSKTVPWR